MKEDSVNVVENRELCQRESREQDWKGEPSGVAAGSLLANSPDP